MVCRQGGEDKVRTLITFSNCLCSIVKIISVEYCSKMMLQTFTSPALSPIQNHVGGIYELIYTMKTFKEKILIPIVFQCPE